MTPRPPFRRLVLGAGILLALLALATQPAEARPATDVDRATVEAVCVEVCGTVFAPSPETSAALQPASPAVPVTNVQLDARLFAPVGTSDAGLASPPARALEEREGRRVAGAAGPPIYVWLHAYRR